MNKKQKSKLHEIFVDEILNDEYTRSKGPFTFNIYTSDKSSKIVIKCINEGIFMMFYTIDYKTQEFLPECNGLNSVNTNKFSLNCEMLSYPPTIFYTLNSDLTDEFNALYNL